MVVAGANAVVEPSSPIDSSGHETWYDVEAGCFVDQDLLPFPQTEAVVNVRGSKGTPRGGLAKQVRFADPPATEQKVDPFSGSSSPAAMNPFDTVAAASFCSPPGQEDWPSTPAEDQPHSDHGLSEAQIDPCDNDRTRRSASEEPAPYSLPHPLGEESSEGRDESACELERDMLLAFEEQEKSSAATSLSSTLSLHRSAEPLHPVTDQDRDRDETSHFTSAELGYSPRLRRLDQSVKEPHEQEQVHKVVAGVTEDEEEEDDDDDGDGEREQRGEKRQHQEEAQEDSSSDRHEIGGRDDGDDEDDEDPRPAKRRKLPPASAEVLTPHSPTPLRRSQSLTPSSRTQPDNTQSQANHAHTPIPADARTSRSPAMVESGPVAEYDEWPFQGFFKRTRIGNETTYSLEFQLPHVPEHLHIPVLSEALGITSDKETSAEAAPLRVVPHSKVHLAAVRRKATHVSWTPEEEATVLKMKEDGCSWEEIRVALPHRSKGTIQVRYSTKLKKQRRRRK